MPSLATSGLDFCNKDWLRVRLRKDGSHTVSRDLEKSTGDLYGLGGDPDSVKKITEKAAKIFIATSVYTIGMIAISILRLIATVTSIVLKILISLPQNLKNKKLFAALTNATFSLMWEIPLTLIKEIERCVKAPFFGIAMMAASLYTLVSPFEGRKWLGKIEFEWHEGCSYKNDLRHRRSEEEWKKIPYSELLKEVMAGKIYYLGYCMQKRGNINDKKDGKMLYKRVVI